MVINFPKVNTELIIRKHNMLNNHRNLLDLNSISHHSSQFFDSEFYEWMDFQLELQEKLTIKGTWEKEKMI